MHGVRCVWLSAAERAEPARIVPDACMDVIWNGETLLLAGPDTRAVWTERRPGRHVLGVRFQPGHGARLIDAPADALRNARAPLDAWWGDAARRLSDDLAAEPAPRRALGLLERAVASACLRAAPHDALVDAVVRELANDAPAHVATLARRFGVSERQLLRRCNAQLGYGPKFCLRVLRFQRFMRALRASPSRTLVELALEAGYADQAHLGHEVAELCGATPGDLRAEAEAAGESRAMSDSNKTPPGRARHAHAHANLRR
jgi:AraC-like DNA-binding protein